MKKKPKSQVDTPVVINRIEKTSMVSLDDLVQLQGKLKRLDESSYRKFKSLLINNGFSMPFLVWHDTKKKKKLLDGHQRLATLKMMKAEGIIIPDKFLAVEVIAENEKMAKQILIGFATVAGKMTDESLADFALESDLSLDFITNNLDLPFLSGLDKLATGDDSKKDGHTDPNHVPEPPKKAKSKLGEIYKLGAHRLMCGDSTSIDAVEKLMNGEKAKLCFTSPPYSDQREYNGGKELSTEYLSKFISTAFGKSKYFAVNLGYQRKNGEVFPYWNDYIKEANACGLKLLSWNIWDRGLAFSIGQQTAMFPIEHEWIFVFGGSVMDLNTTIPNKTAGGKTGVTNRNADGALTRKESYEVREVREFRELGTICRIGVDSNRSINHPAKFPVELPEQYINAMTNNDENIYEPFGGSGSTLIACEKTNRKCFMMELDPIYIDVIIQRWQEFTGQQAVKVYDPVEGTLVL